MSIYSDKGDAQRIRRPLQRSAPKSVPGLDDAKTRLISEVATQHPRFTPEEVHAAIRHSHKRRDITVDMVRYVLTA